MKPITITMWKKGIDTYRSYMHTFAELVGKTYTVDKLTLWCTEAPEYIDIADEGSFDIALDYCDSDGVKCTYSSKNTYNGALFVSWVFGNVSRIEGEFYLYGDEECETLILGENYGQPM